MALSLHNLFADETEDFEDEDFLSLVEVAEGRAPEVPPAGSRLLRPISRPAEEPVGPSPSSPSAGRQRSAPAPGFPTFGGDGAGPSEPDQDADDAELLSACSELETGGPLAKRPRAGGLAEAGAPGRGSGALQLRPSGVGDGPGVAGRAPAGSVAETWPRASPVPRSPAPRAAPAPLSSPRPPTFAGGSALPTPVVTNHLLQLVTAANRTPRRGAWESPSPKARRFPGPAGLLPQQTGSKDPEEMLVSSPHTPSHGAVAKLRDTVGGASPQPMEEELGRGPWAAMKAELRLDEGDPACFLRSYSVVMVLRKAALRQLPKNKVPRMAVTLKSLTPANGDASAVFRDPTGEIQGTVHHLLLEEREREFKAGSVLLLQKVGVFSPSHRNHYLNVTPSNLVKIYPPEEGVEGEEGRSAGIRVSQTSRCAETDVNSNLTRSAPRPSPNTQEPGAWDMDDLDSFLCDLPEDTSCCEQDPAPLPTASPPHRLIPRGGGDNYTLTPPISDTSGPARDWPSRS